MNRRRLILSALALPGLAAFPALPAIGATTDAEINVRRIVEAMERLGLADPRVLVTRSKAPDMDADEITAAAFWRGDAGQRTGLYGMALVHADDFGAVSERSTLRALEGMMVHTFRSQRNVDLALRGKSLGRHRA